MTSCGCCRIGTAIVLHVDYGWRALGEVGMAMQSDTSDFSADRKRLLEQAAEARLRAHSVAPGAERDRLIRQARTCEIGAKASPGAQLPN
jgi:hypothetical protein